MGNLVTMGYAAGDAEEPATNDYVQRLAAPDLRRYTEGYRRICRLDTPGMGGAATDTSTSTSASASPSKLASARAGVARVAATAPATSAATTTPPARGAGLSKKNFRNKLLAAFTMIPHSLSDRLFEVLDANHTGELSLENVLSGISWLKHGTKEEQEQLLFVIYDLDGTGLISRAVMDRFMDVVYGRKRARSATTVEFLNHRVFQNRSSLTLEEFRTVVHECDALGEPLLTKWLDRLAEKIGLDEDSAIVALEKQYNPVVIRHRIAESTLFSINEVSALEKQFHRLFDTKGGASDRIPCQAFMAVLKEHFPLPFLQRFCAHYPLTITGMVLFDDFCTFLSKFCRGDAATKSKHVFELYRDATTEHIAQEQLNELVQVARRCDIALEDRDSTPPDYGNPQEDAVPQVSMGERDFIKWATTSGVLRHLLQQMTFGGCILFGIKPSSSDLEKRMTVYHWQHATRQIQVGQTWNLIGAKWWESWCQYSGINQFNGTPHGSLPFPSLSEDVLVVKATKTAAASRNSSDAPPRPGPVANWNLLQRSGSRRLKERLVLGEDFYLVPGPVYTALVSWYSGGPELPRSIVSVDDTLEVELFPLVLRVARVDPANGSAIMSGEEVLLSSLSTVESLLQATCKALLLTKLIDRARLWYFNENSPEQKSRLYKSQPEQLEKLTQSSVFLLEIQDEDGSWPLLHSLPKASNGSKQDDQKGEDRGRSGSSAKKRPRKPADPSQSPPRPLNRTSEICSRGNLESLSALGGVIGVRGAETKQKAEEEEVEDDTTANEGTIQRRFSKDAFTGSGLVGLDNLGNTCYMSSALQCLSHTRLLVDYFKNEDYLYDVNLNNRDGTNGKLAVAFGELLRVLWTSEKKKFAPNDFKRVLSKFNPQFKGSDQHDAQELLACLLGSLSEDLNRIMVKPYTEQPDSDGRCDALVADEWWHNHLKREVSVIVALFTGQYKSLLECDVCHYESARFEPFTFLQLSLPESSFRSVIVTIIFNNERPPMQFSARVKNDGMIRHVKDQVYDLFQRIRDKEARESGVTTDQWDQAIVIGRISHLHTIETLLDERTPLSQIHDKDQLSVFQLDHLPTYLPAKARKSATGSSAGVDSPAASTGSQNESESIDDYADTNGSSSSHTSAKNEVSTKKNEDSVSLQVGASVFVKMDKTREWVAARVIGLNKKNATVDVAFASGVRRYHMPSAKVVQRQGNDAFIFLVHRRVERSTDSFTDAHVTRLFGAPLVLRISLRYTTNYDLYMLVWKRLRRIFNWNTSPAPVSSAELDDEDSMEIGSFRTDMRSLALGQHLTLTRFGFCLRMVTSHGVGCSRCEWMDGCLGCLIVPTNESVVEISSEETIAIDWDIRTLKEEYDPIQASEMDTHESVTKNRQQDNMPLNLDYCMDMFTAPEHIQEAYCGLCKTLRPATKAMDLWRLPPILVIQLKRFCFTQVSRRKLHHLVDFPLKGLNLQEFVAKKREPKRMKETGLKYWLFLGGKLKRDESSNELDGDKPTRDPSRKYSSINMIPALDAPATATLEFGDMYLYDLYAVVNHVGALGGGHYFAYVLSGKDGKWKCFNDHQCKDLDAKEVVSSTAYILFYVRRDIKHVRIEDLFPPKDMRSSHPEAAASTSVPAPVEELIEQSRQANNSSGCVIS
ncbi:TPA: hypothetical protein N0F65_010909 [Lagenidium giganteum]|uniref:ubiquitinyl hydrolase 1 n=1 Tax=Lagenidium giganteum TaxID=4803 RepID=A0AAV2Z0V2_9STRA|nr:TPA: hypothetical protein N0F65_010909 [Lagenidium giganteum]